MAAQFWNMTFRTFMRPIVLAIAIVAVSPTLAGAQSLGRWGGWNDYGDGWQGVKPRRTEPRAPASPDASRYPDAFPAYLDGGPRPAITPMAPDRVAFSNVEKPGTILIDTENRRLYFTLSHNDAYEYPISVGREGFTWTGTETISRIAAWPDWYPPEEMRQRDPRLPIKMEGGIRNPLGAVALFLGNTLYRIHGTNDRKTIGIAASSGCFRMLNEHAVHLASLASVGTTVKVLPRLPPPKTSEDRSTVQKNPTSSKS
ncbi:MAG: L,D-transpeptidase [Hyphomicrobium sp.]